jgi:hypothetical protein
MWAFDDGEGWPGSPSNYPDLLVGELLAMLGLAALWRGEGCHVELAQAEVVACTLGDLLLASVGPEGNDDERGDAWGPFQCVGDEEWVVVCSGRELPDLNEWCASLGAEEVAARCRTLGIPAARMAYPPDLLHDPQLVARGFLWPLDQPDIGPLVLDGLTYTSLPAQRPAPRLGQHTREICSEDLGLSDDEVAALFNAGVLEEH